VRNGLSVSTCFPFAPCEYDSRCTQLLTSGPHMLRHGDAGWMPTPEGVFEVRGPDYKDGGDKVCGANLVYSVLWGLSRHT
jgi:hypothetical protein